MELFEKALALSDKRFKQSSLAVYASMWRSFERRLGEQGLVPGTETEEQLQHAIQDAGNYLTQRKLFKLVSWVYSLLRDAGAQLGPNLTLLEGLYRDRGVSLRAGVDAHNLEQLVVLTQLPSRSWKQTRLSAMVSLLVETGVRQNELLALKKSDVLLDLATPLVRVVRGKQTRELALSQECIRRVTAWLRAYPAGQDIPWLFVASADGSPMDGSTVWRQLNRLCRTAFGDDAPPRFGSGAIRASVAKTHEQEGPRRVRELLGHKQEASTTDLLERVRVRRHRTSPLSR